MSLPSYQRPQSILNASKRLALATRTDHHQFWHDSVSILDPDFVDSARVHGSRQLTDVYLLALATARDGRLVTLDRRIALATVPKATEANLVVL